METSSSVVPIGVVETVGVVVAADTADCEEVVFLNSCVFHRWESPSWACHGIAQWTALRGRCAVFDHLDSKPACPSVTVLPPMNINP